MGTSSQSTFNFTVNQTESTLPFGVAVDANGNVTELLNTDGSTATKYGYDPFGNAILADDTDSSGAVSENPFRFSTKYTDDETDLVYYGQRYYHGACRAKFCARDTREWGPHKRHC